LRLLSRGILTLRGWGGTSALRMCTYERDTE
jgi:hypothetical protein